MTSKEASMISAILNPKDTAVPLLFDYVYRDAYTLRWASKGDQVVLHFFPPECLFKEEVREAARRSYAVHQLFGEAIKEAWNHIFGEDDNCHIELVREEVAPEVQDFGSGQDNWCLRVNGYHLDDRLILKRFNELLNQVDESLVSLLQRFLPKRA
jgi:hypothetical protein